MQTAAFNNREGGSDVRRWGGGYHVHMPRRFNGSRGSKNGRDLRAGLLGHVDALCELGIACRMAMACTARCSRAPPPHPELAAASALLFKASRGRHSCLISDFKCRAAAGEAHAANWFMSEWFTSRKLGAKSGPTQMEEEDDSSGGGLSRAPLQHRRPPVALDSDIRRRVPRLPIWGVVSAPAPAPPGGGAAETAVAAHCVSSFWLQAAQLLVDGDPNCSSCPLPHGPQIGQNSPGCGSRWRQS